MSQSKITKKYKNIFYILAAIDLSLVILPPLIFIIIGFTQCEVVSEKVTLSLFLVSAIIFGFISVIMKLNLKSFMWLILIGLTLVLQHVFVIILTIGICTILDELLIEPLKNSYKNKYVINKEIDKRGV